MMNVVSGVGMPVIGACGCQDKQVQAEQPSAGRVLEALITLAVL